MDALSDLEVVMVPVLSDNYAYLLRDRRSGQVAVVDPSEAEPLIRSWEKLKWEKPALVFNTHHHWDHVGGNEVLQQQFGCEIVCSKFDQKRVPGKIGRTLGEGDLLSLGSVRFQAMEIPGHTLGHLALYARSESAVFVGDTLFGMGCGRLFEGTPEMMWHSLSRFKALPGETRVYCGHEYTESNGRFALSVEPENLAIIERMKAVRELRQAGKFTVPFCIEEELRTNPFFRVDLQSRLPAVERFADLRHLKDHFQ